MSASDPKQTSDNASPSFITKPPANVDCRAADPSFKAKLVDLGVEPFATSPTEFGKFIIEYTEKWEKVIRAAGIKLE